MKLLVFAHKPPPHHGQSYMVELLVNSLGGDARKSDGRNASGALPDQITCYHVDARLSDDAEDIGRPRAGKLVPLLKYCAEALWCRLRYGADLFYYVPAPGVRAPLYRDWIVMALCRPFFKKLVLHWHAIGLGEWLDTKARAWERRLTRLLLGRADLSLVLGPFYRDDVARLSPKRIMELPNGIPDPCPDFETAVWPRRQARQELRNRILASSESPITNAGPDGDVYRILYLSLCLREKGLFDSVEAVALLNQKLIGVKSAMRVRLFVAGKFWHDVERREFETRIKQPDLQRKLDNATVEPVVQYLGFASGEEKARLLRDSDCFCFPTYYASEGQPVSLLEAMAHALPLVTTRWRAIPGLFPTGYQGLVEPRSPKQVADALEAFMTTSESISLRKQFLQHFTLDRFRERFIEALTSQV